MTGALSEVDNVKISAFLFKYSLDPTSSYFSRTLKSVPLNYLLQQCSLFNFFPEMQSFFLKTKGNSLKHILPFLKKFLIWEGPQTLFVSKTVTDLYSLATMCSQ